MTRTLDSRLQREHWDLWTLTQIQSQLISSLVTNPWTSWSQQLVTRLQDWHEVFVSHPSKKRMQHVL